MMVHAKARRREEKGVHAETRSRGGVAPAAQRLSPSRAADTLLFAGADGHLDRTTSASPRLRVNHFFAPSRLRANNSTVPTHV